MHQFPNHEHLLDTGICATLLAYMGQYCFDYVRWNWRLSDRSNQTNQLWHHEAFKDPDIVRFSCCKLGYMKGWKQNPPLWQKVSLGTPWSTFRQKKRNFKQGKPLLMMCYDSLSRIQLLWCPSLNRLKMDIPILPSKPSIFMWEKNYLILSLGMQSWYKECWVISQDTQLFIGIWVTATSLSLNYDQHFLKNFRLGFESDCFESDCLHFPYKIG